MKKKQQNTINDLFVKAINQKALEQALKNKEVVDILNKIKY